jgi:hypothetical protein
VFDEIPSGVLENEETEISSGRNGVSWKEKPYGEGKYFEKMVGFVDGNSGSIGVQWKRGR